MDDQDMRAMEENMAEPAEIQPAPPVLKQEGQPNHMATASMVLGIVAVLTCCCNSVVFAFAGLSILFALLSRPDGKMTGQARAGVILSVVAIVLMVLFWILMYGLQPDNVGSLDVPTETFPDIPNLLTITGRFLRGGWF